MPEEKFLANLEWLNKKPKIEIQIREKSEAR